MRPVLRRRGGRDVLHRRFLGHTWKLVEEGYGKCAAYAVGIGSAEAGNAQDGGGGANSDGHGQSPRGLLPLGGRSWRMTNWRPSAMNRFTVRRVFRCPLAPEWGACPTRPCHASLSRR